MPRRQRINLVDLIRPDTGFVKASSNLTEKTSTLNAAPGHSPIVAHDAAPSLHPKSPRIRAPRLRPILSANPFTVL